MSSQDNAYIQRPHTPNDPYTVMSEEQIRNIKKVTGETIFIMRNWFNVFLYWWEWGTIFVLFVFNLQKILIKKMSFIGLYVHNQ